ncbi:MAG: archease [Elusimicrobia bacterium]|nr:archease [Elusimicrobiota bacterium]
MPERSDKGYEFFEHTADVGLRAYGATREELFVHAAQGLITLLVEDSSISPKEMRPINLDADSIEELLRLWLKELLFWFNTDRFLPGTYQLEEINGAALRARLTGERFDASRHMHGVEVKGVTYHEFRVAQTPQGWEASIIFDV